MLSPHIRGPRPPKTRNEKQWFKEKVININESFCRDMRGRILTEISEQFKQKLIKWKESEFIEVKIYSGMLL